MTLVQRGGRAGCLRGYEKQVTGGTGNDVIVAEQIPWASAVSPSDDNVRSLLRYAVLLTGNRDDAEDLVQESQAKLMEAYERGVQIEFPEAYLKRILVTTFLNDRRRSDLWRRTVPRLFARDHQPGADQGAAQRDQIWRALDRLPSRQKAAVLLRYFQDLTFREAAVVLGCPEPTVRSLVFRALKALRVTIVEENDQ